MEEREQPKVATTTGRIATYEGAVAIITGAASGIGRGLAEALAEKKARVVVLADRQVAKAEEVAAGIRSRYPQTQAKVYEVDVREYETIQNVIKETFDTYGRLDYMFNNAGVSVAGPMDVFEVDDFDYILDVNLRGVTNGVHAAYRVMKEQGFGHIVNTSSVAGILPFGEQVTNYGTSKFALVGLSHNLRIEGARHGVRVSVICPGAVDTPILKGGGEFGIDRSQIPPEKLDEFQAKQHLMDPNKFATKVLKQLARNKATIIIPGWPWKMIWFLQRLSPSLGLYLAGKINDKMVKKLSNAPVVEGGK